MDVASAGAGLTGRAWLKLLGLKPSLRTRFLACAELFAYGRGREWLVAHYRFAPR